MPAVGVLVKTVVFDQDIYRRFGMANRWLSGMTREFTAFAVAKAPFRTGELKRGIHGDTEQVGERQIEGTIQSDANHTLFVIGGTTGPIMADGLWAAGGDPNAGFQTLFGSIDPKTGKFTTRRIKGVQRKPYRIRRRGQGFWMGVRPTPSSYYPVNPKTKNGSTPRMFVDGQEGKNFLFEAWRLTSRNHSSIRGTLPAHLDF